MTEYIQNMKKARNGDGKLSLTNDLLLCIFSALFASLMGLGTFGVLFVGIAGAAYAFEWTASRRPVKLLAPLLAFGFAFLMSGEVIPALTSLAFIPVSAVMVYLIIYEKSVTVSTVAITTVLFFILCTSFSVELMGAYGLTLKESLQSFAGDIKESIRFVIDLLAYPGEDGQIYSYSEKVIEEYTELIYMAILPAGIILCEFLAYFAAVSPFFFSKITNYPLDYAKGSRVPSLAFPASVIFTLAYIVSFFAYSSPAVSYGTLYMIVIIMPFAAVEGAIRVFGKKGILRKGSKGTRSILIITGAVTLILSPFAFGPLLAVIGSVGVLGDGIARYLKNRLQK